MLQIKIHPEVKPYILHVLLTVELGSARGKSHLFIQFHSVIFMVNAMSALGINFTSSSAECN